LAALCILEGSCQRQLPVVSSQLPVASSQLPVVSSESLCAMLDAKTCRALPGRPDEGVWAHVNLARPAPLVTSRDFIHHHDMGFFRQGLLLGTVSAMALVTTAFAGVIEDVRIQLANGNFSGAESALNSYKAQRGTDPEYLEALSWLARGALSNQQYAQADHYAEQTRTLALQQLKNRKLDAEPHLPTALGAAFEVQAQALAAEGKKPQASLLLRNALATYGNTSIGARLHKNLNLLSFVGRQAPPIKSVEYIGMPPASLAQMKGTPVLLFFWAHWCVDCKGEAPILARLRSEFPALMFVAPTQRYGYAARGEDATPQAELAYIKTVWQQYYQGLQGISVPVNQGNFNVYGASTTPTLVLVDRTGKIAFYHPGALPYEELRGAIERTMKGGGTGSGL
jgi:thiol-disulfide isomerase/thioredoxin